MKRASAATKIVFITGAAAGIGRAAALRFAREGWQVAIADVHEPGLRCLEAELGAHCPLAVALDVSDADAVRASFERLGRATEGRLHLLLNNAGMLELGAFEEIPLARHERIQEVNVRGVLNCTYLAFPYLRGTHGARVINLSSQAANYGVPTEASYSASKFWVRGFTEALNLEWKRHGIHVCDVMPNFVKTAMTRHAHGKIVEHVGVNLSAEEVAEVIWRAAREDRVHWVVEKSSALALFSGLYWALFGNLQKLVVKRAAGL